MGIMIFFCLIIGAAIRLECFEDATELVAQQQSNSFEYRTTPLRQLDSSCASLHSSSVYAELVFVIRDSSKIFRSKLIDSADMINSLLFVFPMSGEEFASNKFERSASVKLFFGDITISAAVQQIFVAQLNATRCWSAISMKELSVEAFVIDVTPENCAINKGAEIQFQVQIPEVGWRGFHIAGFDGSKDYYHMNTLQFAQNLTDLTAAEQLIAEEIQAALLADRGAKRRIFLTHRPVPTIQQVIVGEITQFKTKEQIGELALPRLKLGLKNSVFSLETDFLRFDDSVIARATGFTYQLMLFFSNGTHKQWDQDTGIQDIAEFFGTFALRFETGFLPGDDIINYHVYQVLLDADGKQLLIEKYEGGLNFGRLCVRQMSVAVFRNETWCAKFQFNTSNYCVAEYSSPNPAYIYVREYDQASQSKQDFFNYVLDELSLENSSIQTICLNNSVRMFAGDTTNRSQVYPKLLKALKSNSSSVSVTFEMQGDIVDSVFAIFDDNISHLITLLVIPSCVFIASLTYLLVRVCQQKHEENDV